MTEYQDLMLVEAGPDEVFRLIAGIESWQYLMPHVRSVEAVRPARWRVVLVWRWLPVTVALSSMADPMARLAELRVAAWPGVRASVRWVVDPGPDDTASIRIEAGIVQGPPVVRALAARVLRDLCRDSLDMVRLLAEADRIAHQRIEE